MVFLARSMGGVGRLWSSSQATVVINDFELNPPCPDNRNSCMESVELYNPTDAEISLGGWYFQTEDGEILNISTGQSIGAGEYQVFQQARWLDNDDSVSLINGENRVVDETPFKSDDENDDWTWQRCPDGGDTWRFREVTLGSENEC